MFSHWTDLLKHGRLVSRADIYMNHVEDCIQTNGVETVGINACPKAEMYGVKVPIQFFVFVIV